VVIPFAGHNFTLLLFPPPTLLLSLFDSLSWSRSEFAHNTSTALLRVPSSSITSLPTSSFQQESAYRKTGNEGMDVINREFYISILPSQDRLWIVGLRCQRMSTDRGFGFKLQLDLAGVMRRKLRRSPCPEHESRRVHDPAQKPSPERGSRVRR
jgi:hypothetical protein